MNETDLPCSNCGTELIEQTIDVRELPVSTNWQGDVRLAVCPACDARYYTEDAISRLAQSVNSDQSRRGIDS
jgi:hypothetical protein